MRVCVCGLGYVGAVTSACLARLGHDVVGVDVHPAKVEAVNAGQSPFVEHGLPELVAEMVGAGRLKATVDLTAAFRDSDVTLVCVGTPSRPDGSLNPDFVVGVCRQIGEALRDSARFQVVAIRSTVLPGLTRGEVLAALERSSGKKAGPGFGLCFNPEFLREGVAIEDFFNPSRTVIGALDSASGDMIASMYQGVPGPLIRTSLEVAEMLKYADNSWHAVKVAFANEIGTLAGRLGIDGAEVMNIFALDTKLNISAKYLRPGLPFGGSCLPKDMRALTRLASGAQLSLPLLESVLASNSAHLARTLERIKASGARRIGLLGLTFKPGTDDLRESPAVELAATLVNQGFDVRLHDDNVDLDALVGANRAFLIAKIPGLRERLTRDADALCRSVEAIALIHDIPKYRALAERYGKTLRLIDCSRPPPGGA